MKRLLVFCTSVLTLVVLVACEKKPDAPAPTANDTPAAQTPTAAAAPAATEQALAATALDLDKVAVEEQYEAEVETEITKANFEQQLDALEKEIQAP